MPQPVTSPRESQSAGAVLMVRPARFAFNPETAASNAFQASDAGREAVAGTDAIHELALREFDGVAGGLAGRGVDVIVAEDTAVPAKPDAVFPNNWVSFHHDGSVVLYPMFAPNRRLERREEIVRHVTQTGSYRTSRLVDLSYREEQAKFLEGTGSLVLDRANGIAYATLSARTDLDVLGEFAQQLDYDLVTFESADATGLPVYHTNVMMAVGTAFAVVCGEAIVDPVRRIAVLDTLRSSGHEVIEISKTQMHQFAGNLLELKGSHGNVIALSTTAWASFGGGERRSLERHAGIFAADVPVIERLGGGGVRCMLAEIHLPKR